eukprot:GHVS01077829.1.p1 GENE.GHVS01077829.1~~GHVS01077829.1.p1  ORF type:complete len:681 (-),score=149.35 GHVS01077829.1:88-1929(-)
MTPSSPPPPLPPVLFLSSSSTSVASSVCAVQRSGVWATVDRETDEFRQAEYLLQLSCRTSRVAVTSMHVLHNHNIADRFLRRAQGGGVIVHSFVSVSELDEEDNSLQDVCRRGLHISEQGMKFTIGNFSLPAIPLMRQPADLTATALTGGTAGGGVGVDLLDPYLISLAVGPESRLFDQDESDKNRFLRLANMQLLTGERCQMLLLLCRVAVGKAIQVGSVRDAPRRAHDLPEGFDSAVLLHPPTPPPSELVTVHYPLHTYSNNSDNSYSNNSNNSDNSSSNNSNNRAGEGVSCGEAEGPVATLGVLPVYTFRQEYIVYDTSQVEPLYLVNVSVDPSQEELFAVPLCDSCKDQPSSKWCAADGIRLCEACDEKLHSINALVSRHTRVPINEMPRAVGRCERHPVEEYTLFCNRCQVPVCRLCVAQQHNHTSTGDSLFSLGRGAAREEDVAKELFQPIARAYRAALQNCSRPHRVLSASRRTLNGHLELLNRLRQDVENNAHDQEDQLYAQLHEALRQLETATEEQLSITKSYQVELCRQFDEIQWSEKFLATQKAVLPPADYLQAWLRHRAMQAEREGLCTHEDPSEHVLPDVALEGSIVIATDSGLRHLQQH